MVVDAPVQTKNHLGDRNKFLPTVHGLDDPAQKDIALHLLFVVDGNTLGGLPVLVRALCRDGEDHSIIGNYGSPRCNHFTVLTQSRLERIGGGEVDSNRVCPVGPLANNGIAFAVQVGSVFELLSAAIAIYTFDADLHAHRTRHDDPSFTLPWRAGGKL